jgi:hypothetical protein
MSVGGHVSAGGSAVGWSYDALLFDGLASSMSCLELAPAWLIYWQWVAFLCTGKHAIVFHLLGMDGHELRLEYSTLS